MAGPINWLQQIAAVSRMSLETLWERKGSSAAALFGIAGVVAVLVGVLSIAAGFRHALRSAGRPDTAIVLRSGSDSEMMSGIARADTRIIAEAPGVARDGRGALASAELFVVINLPKRSTGTDANVPLRGVEPAAFRIRDGFEIVAGRPFAWGKNEVIVGAGAAGEFAGLDLGGELEVGASRWQVVGIFTTGGGIADSEIWTDAAVLQPAYRRGDTFQAVYARLTAPEAFEGFQQALAADPRLNVKVVRQTDFYAEQSTVVSNLITGLGVFIVFWMSLGALFGALNTMYTAVAARTREIATLRALGFRGGPVVLSVLCEALLLALVGGLLGGGGAYLVFDGFRAATINWQTFSQVAFAFRVSPLLLAIGIVIATLIGLLGGLFPAVRAARMPVAEGLREP